MSDIPRGRDYHRIPGRAALSEKCSGEGLSSPSWIGGAKRIYRDPFSSCYLHDVMSSVPTSDAQIFAACEHALRLAPAEYPKTLSSYKEFAGAPEWYSFEQDAWPIGESIRRAFVENPKLKRKDAVLAKIVEVARCRNLRRGRQSFVMALGFVAARNYAEALVPFLSDPDVNGQVLFTLIKMKAPGFAREVTPLLLSNQTWIRRLAKKYIDRYPTKTIK